MKKCDHKQRLAHSWWNGRWIKEPYIPLRDAALILCVNCHATLPLGPARDDERTAVEVRAAEIAGWPTYIGCEACGWSAHEWGDVNSPHVRCERNQAAFDAGYLARCIVNHEREQLGERAA